VPDFLPSLLDSRPALYGGALLAILVILLLWQVFGRGPRRRRTFRKAHRLLESGDWQEALGIIQQIQAGGSLSQGWQQSLRSTAGKCHQAAGRAALEEKDFETALEHGQRAAQFLNKQEFEARSRVVEAMLEEVRRLYAASRGADTGAIHPLLARLFLIQKVCLEASFWQGLCHLCDGHVDLALVSLQTARTGTGGLSLDEDLMREPDPSPSPSAPKTSFIEPALYVGALLLRKGQAKEALLYLTEANRVDANNAFVTCQLGAAMIAAGGDALLAVKALQKALGPRGLEMWAKNPQRAWAEGFPEHRSYIRRLAAKYPFVCPIWGADTQIIVRQGLTALAQGLYRLGNFEKSSEIFGRLIQETAPTLPVLRGLGLTLARLGRYDEAFKHLRTAHELEEGRDRITAGYLALCGAKGKPARPEDKARNLQWAIRLLTQFSGLGDAEWTALASAIFTEARLANLPVAPADQLYLCDHLASVNAVDSEAAEAYHHLMGSAAGQVKSEYAWLYCRAAEQHGHTGAFTLPLFALTFQEEAQAREFFRKNQWDFGEVEFTYLERTAALQPGAFPAALGLDYPGRGEQQLLSRSLQQEQAKDTDAARATVEIWLKLAPHSPHAHDRLAHLCYKTSDLTRAVDLLQEWHRLDPQNPWPLVRQAVLHQQRGEIDACYEGIRQALGLTQGRLHADIAFLGARLILKLALADQSPGASFSESQTAALRTSLTFLSDCLMAEPAHWQALAYQAGVRWLVGERQDLARQAGSMNQPEVSDPRFHYLAALCHLAARDPAGMLDSCRRAGDLAEMSFTVPTKNGAATGTASLIPETAYLAGLAYLLEDDAISAMRSLRETARAPEVPSAGHAQALLGKMSFSQGAYAEAIQWWQALDAEKRAGWKFSEALAGAVFLTALEAFEAGRFEQAADKIREAGRLGWRDRRLGLLLTLSLVKAGQELLYR
jgi:tetratricopeptide (TPR) repeat protein